MIVRISRAIISHPLKPVFPSLAHEIPQVNKSPQVYTKYPARYYLFPSIYRSFFSSYRLSVGHYHEYLAHLMPFRTALNELKRRLFFAGLYFRSFLRFYSLFRVYAYHYTQFFSLLDSNEKQRRGEKEEFCVIVMVGYLNKKTNLCHIEKKR